MALKPWNLDRWIFRVNVAATGAVFVLLLPTTEYITENFLPRKDAVWIYPLTVLGGSALLWFLTSLCLPLLIRWGIVEDRRAGPRPGMTLLLSLFRRVIPIVNLGVHVALLVFLSVCLIAFMRGDTMLDLFKNLP
ncbi:MAG: hypothetical protein Q8R76_05465 [Candidatus Omnitrophota bacterium]|nr:hypothetical protein [Candidatus Omnitrophota bacterium]